MCVQQQQKQYSQLRQSNSCGRWLAGWLAPGSVEPVQTLCPAGAVGVGWCCGMMAVLGVFSARSATVGGRGNECLFFHASWNFGQQWQKREGCGFFIFDFISQGDCKCMPLVASGESTVE